MITSTRSASRDCCNRIRARRSKAAICMTWPIPTAYSLRAGRSNWPPAAEASSPFASRVSAGTPRCRRSPTPSNSSRTTGPSAAASILTTSMRKIAEGDTTTAIPARERGDEVGAMAQSVQIFKDNMIEAVRLRAEQEELKQRGDADKKGFLSKLADDFESGVRRSLDTLTGA